MSAYKPLTKIIVDENGNEAITCQYYGSNECRRIHNTAAAGCADCPMLAAILNQLHAFEEIYMEEDRE